MARRTGLLLICLTLAVVCYYAPWFSHHTAGFTMNGYDLAEWTSLHPAVRSSSPSMLTSFLLRFPHMVLAIALALVANRMDDPRWCWAIRGLSALLVLRMVPPIDFFTGSTDDPNYRQMAFLTVLGLIGITAASLLSGRDERRSEWLLTGVLAFGLLVAWAGMSRTTVLLDNFEIAARVGSGFIGYIALTFVAGVIALWPVLRDARRGHRRRDAIVGAHPG